jgi:osmotically-inducible protein OsmY
MKYSFGYPTGRLLACLLTTSTLTGCAAPLLLGAAATAGYVGLQTRPAAQVGADSETKIRIKDRLAQARFAYVGEIGIDVFYGDVLLTGTVPTMAEAERVLQIVQQTQGVGKVYNELFTDTATTVSQKARDTWIAAQIQPRLLGTRQSLPLNYLISVVNGHVYIIGEVASSDERNHTLHVLRTTKGVVQVHDYLRQTAPDSADERTNRVSTQTGSGLTNPFRATGQAPNPLPVE